MNPQALHRIFLVNSPLPLRGRGVAAVGRYVLLTKRGYGQYETFGLDLLPSAAEKGHRHTANCGGFEQTRFNGLPELVTAGILVEATAQQVRRLAPHLPKAYKQKIDYHQ